MKPARIVSWMLIGLVLACIWEISKSEAIQSLAQIITNLF